jgi:hypothetical protein
VPAGGSLIVEFTDCRHFVGRLSRLFSWAKELIAPPKYTTNRLSFRQVAEIFDRQHLRLVSVFRYANVPVPGVERFVTNETLFALVKFAFGKAGKNRNAWLGNEYICLLRAD